jgi:hypothetical protein
MRRTSLSGSKINVSVCIPINEMIGSKYESGRDIAVADAKAVSDRKLKALLCDYGSVTHCKSCEAQCAYGREFVRRKTNDNQGDNHSKGRHDQGVAV